MDAERPRACLGVGVHGSTLAFREGADLAHRSLGKGVGFGADDSDCRAQSVSVASPDTVVEANLSSSAMWERTR